ncbi:MAG: tautomerase family protein [Pseudomonadota bacterium]
MAIVSVTIIEGRDQDTKAALMAKLTDAVVDVLGAKPQQVRVIIHEVKDGAYSVAGTPVFLKEHQ